MIHSLRVAGVALLVAGLGACGSAPTHFHTLVPPSASLPPATAPFAIDVLPVGVPPQVDQPALVLRQGATGIAVLDGERWASPLGDEIRGALSADLAARLGTHDVHGLPRGKEAKVVRVQLDVRRFDSEVGGNATLEASWSVRGALSFEPAPDRRKSARPPFNPLQITGSERKRLMMPPAATAPAPM